MLLESVTRSAAPAIAGRVIERLAERRPDAVDRLVTHDGLRLAGRGLVAVAAASNALGRLCLADESALDVLDALDRPVPLASTGDVEALSRAKRLELLRIAARDLLGLDDLEAVGHALATMAEAVLDRAVTLARPASVAGDAFAVIGMGKLGGRELNYASDVDVMFVSEQAHGDATARAVLRIAGAAFRVDASLRPEGRAGPISRPLSSYRGYWDRWASTWEFQALLKARPVAGNPGLGAAFAQEAASRVWGRTITADELVAVRAMTARSESLVTSRGLVQRELKRAPGGIRDVEFAVQLLQLVHGHHDPDIRDPSTLGALARLGAAGYIALDDARALADAYRFLRIVEHRIQLVEEEQTHAVPTDRDAYERLARVIGYEDDSARTATAAFDEALRQCQAQVRTIHERLFFRPLLEAFAALPAAGGPRLSDDAVVARLAAFGFADAARTHAAIAELAGGLRRSSRLMEQMLPLLLDWLSLTPDPDLGLLGLRNLVVHGHHRSVMVSTFRESPEAARRLCLLLGSSRALSEAIERNPELIARIDDDAALAPTGRAALVDEILERTGRTPGDAGRRRQLVRVRQDQLVAIAARDLLDLDDVTGTGAALTTVSEALLEAALAVVGAGEGFCVIGLGRFGGGELAYASDLDVLFVHDGAPAGETRAPGATDGGSEDLADRLLRVVHGPSPAERVATLDLGLRPEGSQGRLARDLPGYAAYFSRWAETWERQALTRARLVAGDAALGARFLALVDDFVWERPFTEAEEADVRRMKARIERERIPAREDPQFHLKLGKGSLSDVEWTAQLLQLRHGVACAGTVAALDALEDRGVLATVDAEALRDAYRFCEHTRNRWHLVGALPGGTAPGDALPAEAHQLSRLARSLGTTPATLREEYRRVTRRSRRVVERLFYGIDEA
jgi:[glutamine synthetase] adenylyltransferase / [glutamine synthetase]-adenylyl-L-tyrosine phosphorylase